MDDEKKPSATARQSAPSAPPAPAGNPTEALGALWQSALGQIDEIRDVIVKGSQAGKARIDVQLLKRQREKALVQIGEAVLEEHARGLSLPASCDDLAARVKDLDTQIAAAEEEAQKVFRR